MCRAAAPACTASIPWRTMSPRVLGWFGLFDAKPPMMGQVMTAAWPVAIMPGPYALLDDRSRPRRERAPQRAGDRRPACALATDAGRALDRARPDRPRRRAGGDRRGRQRGRRAAH